MDETNKENPLLKLDENSIEKPNFINDHIKETEINKNGIEKSDLINKMNQMVMNNQMDSMMMNNSIIDQMDMNQKNTMMMMNQMSMNNQMNPNMMMMMNQMSMNNQMNPFMMIQMMMMNQMRMNNQMNPNMMMNQINLEDEKKMNCQNNKQISDKEKINDKGNQGGIIAIFRQSDNKGKESDAISIQCLNDEKASDIIQKYRWKSGNNDLTMKFIYNAKNLNPSLTVAEAGLTMNANIFAVTTKGVKGGGFPMMFTDLSKNRTKEIGFSKKAPSYRKVTKGINIFGICKFKKCKAYKKEVVVRIKKKKLDLIKERDDLLCPECEAIIIPKTVGFYLCKFVIYGKKVENRQEEDFRNEEDEANNKDSLKYFDPELNGEVMVTELIFEVLEYL